MTIVQRSRRHAAAAVETVIVLPVMLILVLGMLDLSVAIMRYHVLATAARHGARQASVHGQLCPTSWNGGPWGPTAFTLMANSSGVPLVDTIKPLLDGFDLTKTSIQASWLDNGNAEGQRVQVLISTTYQPMVTAIFGQTSYKLTASSTLAVSH